MNIIALIPARGGSKGVPRKNIRVLAGKPLIAYTIETAKKCKLINRVIVSTDDHEIAEVSKKYGAEVPFIRPAELATDKAAMFPVMEHAVKYLEEKENYHVDIVVQMDPTSPLRTVEDVEGCLEELLESEDTDMVTTVYESHHSPYFDMMEYNKEGYLELSKKPEKPIVRRQDSPKVYQLNAAVYAFRTKNIARAGTYWTEKVKGHIMPEDRSVVIDTNMEFKLVELLLEEKK